MDAFVVEKKPGAPRPTAKARGAPAATPRAAAADVPSSQEKTPLQEVSRGVLEDELRLFDLDNTFGPFVGVERLVRWQRAQRLGLNPPERVLAILQMDPPRVDAMREGGNLW
jgi:DNA polymerase delta subunit 4